MAQLEVCLFGRMTSQCNGCPIPGLETRKVQELFCYLLLHRQRPHHREVLATRLWEESPGAQARKNLRQTLWQLQTALQPEGQPQDGSVVQADAEWVHLNPQMNCWLDVALFEAAYGQVQEVPGSQLNGDQSQQLHEAVTLYHGDLLEGWYQDWCIFERERLQTMYLTMLDKLASYCEGHGEYERGLAYAQQILRHDRARERTHRRMMRLYYLAGNRTAALRQFASCVAALQEELDAPPARSTLALYEQIRTDRLRRPGSAGQSPALPADPGAPAHDDQDAVAQLRQMRAALQHLQSQVDACMLTVARALDNPTDKSP